MNTYSAIFSTLLLLFLAGCSAGGLAKPRIRNAVSYSGTMSGAMSEGIRTVMGRLEVQAPTSGGYITAIVTTPSGEKLEAKWPEWCKSPTFLDVSKTYEIELMTRIYKDPDYIFNDIRRVSDEGRLLMDTSVCHVHNLPMQRQIEDGKSACEYPEQFFSIQKKRFPNDGNSYLLCGSGIRHPMWKCPECSKQYHGWTKRNGVNESR